MRRVTFFLIAILAVLQIACGGGTTVSPPPPPPAIAVSVSPNSASPRAEETQQFTATVTGTSNTAVTWTVNNIAGGDATVGTISATGLYTAPATLPTPNTVSVRAASVASPATMGTASVTVLNPIPVLASVYPTVAGVGTFTVTVNGSKFVNGAQINFNGTALTTLFISPTILMASATASAAGAAPVKVTNPNPGSMDSASANVQVRSGNVLSATAAARFLEQSTFGPTAESITQLQQVGFTDFLTDQFNAAASTFDNPPAADDPNPLQKRWFTNALYGPDQLRQRVAFALHKIWVVSWVTIPRGDAFVPYLRMHQQHAFTNYRQIMEDVTLNPAMGAYQDIANNDKADPARGIACNENYGRELMQLFTINVWKLNQDGTYNLDAQGKPQPTYDQAVVEGNACALTGWTYPKETLATRDWPRPQFFLGGPLEAVESHHDTNTKVLLNGFVVPAGGSAATDLRLTLDNLFSHPNVAPHVSKLLIQQLATSNPSPAYIQRVSDAFIAGTFNGFGTGQRGDMKATIAAILLDPEARRGDALPITDPAVINDGKLKEPVLFITNLLRVTGAQSDGSNLADRGRRMGQLLLFPPTVFSYFSPEFRDPGTGLLAPEMNILTTASTFERINFVNTYVYGSIGGTIFNQTPFISLAANPDAPGQLLDALNVLMLRGKMSSSTRATILTAVNTVPAGANQNRDRARAAIYLVATSTQYLVQQ